MALGTNLAKIRNEIPGYPVAAVVGWPVEWLPRDDQLAEVAGVSTTHETSRDARVFLFELFLMN